MRSAPSLEMDDPEALREATLAGGGVAALPLFVIEEDLRRGALKTVLEAWAPASASIHVVYASRIAPPLRVRVFLEFVFALCAEGPPARANGAELHERFPD